MATTNALTLDESKTNSEGNLIIENCQDIDNANITFVREGYCENSKSISGSGDLTVEVVILPPILGKLFSYTFKTSTYLHLK